MLLDNIGDRALTLVARTRGAPTGQWTLPRRAPPNGPRPLGVPSDRLPTDNFVIPSIEALRRNLLSAHGTKRPGGQPEAETTSGVDLPGAHNATSMTVRVCGLIRHR